METVKSAHRWVRDKISAYPNAIMVMWGLSLIAIIILMAG